MPRSRAIWVAACGTWVGSEQVATITVSMSATVRPASAMALRPASAPMKTAVSVGDAQRRSWIPTRVRIHSSLVSMVVDSSSLVTTRSGR